MTSTLVTKTGEMTTTADTRTVETTNTAATTTMSVEQPLSDSSVRIRAKATEQFVLITGGENKKIPIALLRERMNDMKDELGLTDVQIKEFLKFGDKNKDRCIDLKEYENMMASTLGRSTAMRAAMTILVDGVIAKNERLKVHSYIDHYNCLPPPTFIILISLVQVCTFLGYYLSTDPEIRGGVMTYCAGCHIDGKPGPLMFNPKVREEVWRFFTYQFLHSGLNHLLGNLVMQLIIGIPLEIVHKFWRIAPVYLLAVGTGACLHYTLDPTISLVGASAGVYALITAHLANVAMNWSEMPFRWVRLAVVGGFVIFDVTSTVYRRVFANECDKISHSAHIAGAITGFCFGLIALHNIVSERWERRVRIVFLIVYVFFVAFIIGAVVFQPHTADPVWDASKCTKKVIV